MIPIVRGNEYSQRARGESMPSAMPERSPESPEASPPAMSFPAPPKARRVPYSHPTLMVARFRLCFTQRGQKRLSWMSSPKRSSMLSVSRRAIESLASSVACGLRPSHEDISSAQAEFLILGIAVSNSGRMTPPIVSPNHWPASIPTLPPRTRASVTGALPVGMVAWAMSVLTRDTSWAAFSFLNMAPHTSNDRIAGLSCPISPTSPPIARPPDRAYRSVSSFMSGP